mgnify:CR=1 FL=1
MMGGVIESLTGRVSIIIMSPLSTREIFNSTEKKIEADTIILANRAKDFTLEAISLLLEECILNYMEIHMLFVTQKRYIKLLIIYMLYQFLQSNVRDKCFLHFLLPDFGFNLLKSLRI